MALTDRVATRPVDKPAPALVIDQLVLRPVYVFGHQRPVRGKDQEPPGAGVLDQQMTAGKQAKHPGEFGADLVFLKDILVRAGNRVGGKIVEQNFTGADDKFAPAQIELVFVEHGDSLVVDNIDIVRGCPRPLFRPDNFARAGAEKDDHRRMPKAEKHITGAPEFAVAQHRLHVIQVERVNIEPAA